MDSITEQQIEFEDSLGAIVDSIEKMLVTKNKSYGNAALEPLRIFSKADPVEQLKVRIDDKLSRIYLGKEYPGDNDLKDLIGYLILLYLAQQKKNV